MAKNKTRLKNQSRTIMALYYWGKLIGINSFTLAKSNHLEFSYCSILYIFILIVLHSYLFKNALVERLNYLMPSETPISVIVDYCGMGSMFFEVVSVWFCNYFFKNRLVSIIKAFEKAEKTSKKLDIPENYNKHFKNLVLYLVFSNTTFAATIWFNNLILMYFPNYHLEQWILFSVARTVAVSFLTLFVWCLFIVKEKFRRLNERTYLFAQNCIPGVHRVVYRCGSMNEVSLEKSRCGSSRLSERLTIILQLHRELRDLLHRLVRHFALFVMFNITTQLIIIIFNVYAIYRYVKTHDLAGPLDFLFVISFLIEMFFPVGILIVESNICGSLLYEANNTGNILHSILNHFDIYFHPEETAKLNGFSLDLLANKTRISVFGLFHLNYFFVYNMIPTATMYLVIMLQFYA